jgi:catechol 2,3-dioxygenase-like lactoylglutathione lyase family enzyme
VTVRHIVPIIRVSDIQPALDFYCNGLGFAKDFGFSISASGPHYAGLSLDGNHLHLSTFSGDGVPGTATYCYVDDIDAMYAGFQARGVTTQMEPTNQDWGMREVYERDPDGNTLRFGSPVLGAAT